VRKVKIDFNKITRQFLLGEGKKVPSVRAYAESVISILDHVVPRSQKENRQLSVAKQHLVEIKRLNRRLEEKINLLEEQINILEEGK